MLNNFWEKESALIKITAFFAALGALFLNISPSNIPKAATALANIQAFCLAILIICLGTLSFRFIKAVRHAEIKVEKKYDIHTGVFSTLVTMTFLWLGGNFITYVLSLYNLSLANFLSKNMPSIMGVLFVLFLFYVERKRHLFTMFSYLVIYSFTVSVLISSLGWWLFQNTTLNKYFEWDWGLYTGVIFLALWMVGLVMILYLKRIALFEPLSPFEEPDLSQPK